MPGFLRVKCELRDVMHSLAVIEVGLHFSSLSPLLTPAFVLELNPNSGDFSILKIDTKYVIISTGYV